MNYAIQVSGLRKSYGNHIVLKGLDFQIEKGEVFSLLGVNGAGKTTSLECIEGFRKYDSGQTAEVFVQSTPCCANCRLPQNLRCT